MDFARGLIYVTNTKTGHNRDAGIHDLRFHDLRHTTGTRLADEGTDAFAIAEVLGHRSLQTTKGKGQDRVSRASKMPDGLTASER